MATWMVVEDEPDIYEVLLLMLEAFGVEGLAFVDGEEALDWIDDVEGGRYYGEMPEVALLDIRLPGKIDGLMVGARLRNSNGFAARIKIVLVTAYKLSPIEEAAALNSSGADLILYKPIPRFDELRRQIDSIV
ncbi:MAG: response regulator [Phototrophicaceae bacterium]|jgi:CheY-like chemotaxis protein